ncbi:MAG TPA: alpha/beta hydrolase [Rhizomicrobium sp.]|jgi:pimeloyl-ACP methyl ester carboxylesterase|nr:alpha/beta hydrolase [Rhizomicrobium sp.]
MFRIFALAIGVLLFSAPAFAVEPFPASFHTEDIQTNGTTLHVRVGGSGPAVVLLHGFGDTGDMWAPVAALLVKNHTVIVPDLRGMGLSAHPGGGYTKKNEAVDIAGVMDHLKIRNADLVTHDIGNMVGYALAAQYPMRITKWVAIDAPLPGIGAIWQAQLSNPKAWHFNFYGPDEERMVAGRESIYLDRFYNELSAHPERIDEATRAHYTALYARPHAIHDAFEQFKAFPQDGVDNRAMLAKGKLTMPVLALGAEKSYGTTMADDLRQVATNVQAGVVPDSGHWIMEENPAATTKLIVDFLAK